MELEFVLLLVACSILLSFLFHRIDMTRNTKKDRNKTVFGRIFIVSIIIIVAGLIVGAWNGLLISAIGVHLLIPSISALFMNLILKKYSNKSHK
ncbi:hypothetical protein [Paenibacillus sp. An7]|uniref:hypothetical protein n=1 Tax=Paenibacillus sp. An7 TaxID=2689577 RepID=UPI00135776F1|nr:hypothetical protein [Paenibacillus sp. An7]